MQHNASLLTFSLLQPYRRDQAVARFQASRRSGRRNAVTEEDLLAIAAVVGQYSSQTDDNCATDASSDHVFSTQTADTRAASLPAELSKLKFAGKAL